MNDLTHDQILKSIRDAGQRIADHAATIADGIDGKLDTYEDVFGAIMTPEAQICAAMLSIDTDVLMIRIWSGQEPQRDQSAIDALDMYP